MALQDTCTVVCYFKSYELKFDCCEFNVVEINGNVDFTYNHYGTTIQTHNFYILEKNTLEIFKYRKVISSILYEEIRIYSSGITSKYYYRNKNNKRLEILKILLERQKLFENENISKLNMKLVT